MTAPPPTQIRPAYGTGSIIDVLPSALAVLTGAGSVTDPPGSAGWVRMADPLRLADRLDGVRRIAVLLVDGLGYHLLPAAGRAGATLADIESGRLGELNRLTAGFPSTTPVSLVGLGTGAPPGAHGVLGFTVRIPGTGRVLNHIRWTDTPDPSVWQPVPTVFEQAAAAGVAVTAVSGPSYAGSGLTVSAYRGATYRGAAGVEPLVARMRESLADGPGPALVYGYHPDLDHAGHAYGVASPEWHREAAEVDRLISMLATDLPADSALLVTADHGQFDVPPDARFDLDEDPRLRAGVGIVAGEPRVRYLHVVPGAAADVMATWRGVLGDAAAVMTRDEVIDGGWFGPVAPGHRERIGDIVVVCVRHHAVVATKTVPGDNRLVALHGSWTAAEMEIPLIVIRGGR